MKKLLYTEAEASEIIGIPPATLHTWRSRPPKNALKFTKVGRLVRYSMVEIQRWIESNTKK